VSANDGPRITLLAESRREITERGSYGLYHNRGDASHHAHDGPRRLCRLDYGSTGSDHIRGLSGVPVWKSDSSPANATPAFANLGEAQLQGDATDSPDWLGQLNRYRVEAGLTPVGASADLSYGSQQHARYLDHNAPEQPVAFAQHSATVGIAAHREEADNPWYSSEGAEAAGGGKRLPGVLQGADVAFNGKDPAEDIAGWMMVPFHRFAFLRLGRKSPVMVRPENILTALAQLH
jgi:hypothetical protein